MNQGDQVKIPVTVLRVEGTRLDAQTADGQLIQTQISNVAARKDEEREHKAILNAPEKKAGAKK